MSLTPTPLTWNQGEDLVVVVNLSINSVLLDLTGYSARMDIARPNATGPIMTALTFNSDDADPLTEDEITMGADGKATIVVSRNHTVAVDPDNPNAETEPVAADLVNATSAKYIYDLFIRDTDGFQRKVMEGDITVKRSVTKWR